MFLDFYCGRRSLTVNFAPFCTFRKPPCGCDKGRCAYETTAALRNLLSDDAAALKAIGPYLESPPRSRFGWVAKFVEIGLGHLRGQSTNGSLPENAKHCLEYHADELIPRL